MGGKTSTTSSQVQIPPEVLARYQAVNATAADVAQTPFQQYSTNPSAFVAPLTPTQTSGIENTNAAAGMAQPYFNAATGFALAGAQPVNAAPLDIGKYMNPYLQTVLGATEAQINQQNQQAQAGQTGTAIDQGYFGGDRSGIAQAVLANQQELAAGQVYSGIASDAFQQAMAAAAQQQSVGLSAAQANRAALTGAGQELAGLGTGAQGAALEGAQAQLGVGQVEQQTEQAGKTALYNQFLQQQSYPFQTAQFAANIAEGTGALSGSTTTTQQPGGLLASDERLKEDMQPIGKGFDGANIYRFRYRGDPTTRIGMSAQEVERKHPEAVREQGGFKAVDYAQATDDAARRGGFALAANDDFPEESRRARQAGGGMSEWGSYPSGVNPMVIAQLLEAQAQMYGPGFGGAGLYGSQGGSGGAPYGGASHVPAANLPVGQLMIAKPPPQQRSPLDAVQSIADTGKNLAEDVHSAHQGYDWWRNNAPPQVGGDPLAGTSEQQLEDTFPDSMSAPDVSDPANAATDLYKARGGFIRAARQDGGDINPYGAPGGLNIPTGYGGAPHQLQTPGAPGAGRSGLDTVGSMAGDVNNLVKGGEAIGKGIGWLSDLASAVPFAEGGFVRAGRDAGGITSELPQPWQAEAGGLGNLYHALYGIKLADGGRPGRQDGGDISDPQNDIPDKPVGPGLNIPNEAQQHQLAVAKPPSQGGGNQTMSDIMDVAKIAAMFAGAARGGRIGRAAGGELPPELAGDTDPDDVRLERDAQTAVAPHPPPPLSMAAAGPGAATDGAPATAAPSAGFAHAAAPGASGEAGGSLGHIIGLEGTAPNPRSSAIGVGQLLDGTYMGLLREAHPEIAAQVGHDPASIKAFRRTPQGLALSAELAPMNQNNNRALMEHQGIAVTPANEHVMWVLGAGDGPKVLHADPSTPLRGLISNAAIAANPSIMGGGQTVGGFLGWARKGMNKGGRAGFALAGDVGDGDGITNTSTAPEDDVFVDDQGRLHATPPAATDDQAGPPPPPPPRGRINDSPPSAPPEDHTVGRQAAAGFARALTPDNAAAPAAGYAPADQSALPPEVEAAAQNQAQAQRNLQNVVRGQTQHPQSGGNFLQRAGSWVSQPEHLIPLVTGIADMLAAPTKYPLVAATQGLKGGLGAYQQQRAYDLQAAQEGAQQGNLGLDANVTAAGLPIRAYEAQNVRLGTNAQGLTSVIDFLGNRYTPTGFPDPNDKTHTKVLWRGPKGNLMTQDEVEAQRGMLAGTAGQFFGGNMTNPLKPGALDVGAPGGVSAGPGAAGPVGSLVGAFGGSGAVSPSGSSDAADGGGGAPNSGRPAGLPPGSDTVVRRRPAVAAPPAHGASAAAAGPSGPAISADPSLRLSPALRADLSNGVFQQAPAAQQVDTSQLDPAWDPKQLTLDIANLQGNKQTEAAGVLQQRLADVTSGKIPPLRKDGAQDFGYQHQQQQIAAGGDRLKANMGLVDEQNKATMHFQAAKGQTMQAWNTLNRLYQDYDFRGWSDHFADTINGLESIPWLRGFISAHRDQWAQAHTDAEKSAVRTQIAQAIESGTLATGAPATTLDTVKLQTPMPGMAPTALYDLNVQNLAALRQKADWSAVWNAPGLKQHVDDPTALYQRWLSENPIERYNKEAYDDVRPYAGMPWADMVQHPRHPQTQAEFDKEIRTYPKGIPIQGLDGKIYPSPGPRQP